mmetsp:Transcript_93875/g.270478  ORF Transcript_93875/g.270478 Transcript_93875/m.270478 type:complete len:256 (-) Transcript_93875:518-1285(-)
MRQAHEHARDNEAPRPRPMSPDNDVGQRATHQAPQALATSERRDRRCRRNPRAASRLGDRAEVRRKQQASALQGEQCQPHQICVDPPQHLRGPALPWRPPRRYGGAWRAVVADERRCGPFIHDDLLGIAVASEGLRAPLTAQQPATAREEQQGGRREQRADNEELDVPGATGDQLADQGGAPDDHDETDGHHRQKTYPALFGNAQPVSSRYLWRGLRLRRHPQERHEGDSAERACGGKEPAIAQPLRGIVSAGEA